MFASGFQESGDEWNDPTPPSSLAIGLFPPTIAHSSMPLDWIADETGQLAPQ